MLLLDRVSVYQHFHLQYMSMILKIFFYTKGAEGVDITMFKLFL